MRVSRMKVPRPTLTWGAVVICVVAAAVALRALYLTQAHGQILFEIAVLDAATYERLADEVWSETGSVAGRAYFRPPLYPLVLGALMRAIGRGAVALTCAQMMLGIATALLAAWSARRLAGEGAALIAGLLTATAPILPFFEGQRLITSLYTFLATALLALGVAACVGRPLRGRAALGAGLLLGISACARPNALVFVPILLVLCGGAGGRPRAAAWLLLGLALPLGAVFARNVAMGGDRVLISSNAGVNLYIGNRPGSDGMSAVPPGHAWQPFVSAPNLDAGRRLTPQETSRYWIGRTLRECGAAPLSSLALLARKTAAFFSATEVPNNLEYRQLARTIPVLRAPLPSLALLAPLAGLGVAVALTRRRRGDSLLLAFLALHLVAVVPFFVCARFRTPALPLLAVLAALGLTALPRLGSRRARLGAAFGLVGGIALGPLDLARAPARLEPGRGHYWVAVAESLRAAKEGDAQARSAALDAADAALARALTEAPGHPDYLLLRAHIASRPPAALADLDAALEAAPEFVLARVARARRLRSLGRPSDALDDFAAALRAEPFHPDALGEGARVAMNLGRLDEARDWSLRLVESHSERPDAWLLHGRVLEARGEPAEAERAIRNAAALDPTEPRIRSALQSYSWDGGG